MGVVRKRHTLNSEETKQRKHISSHLVLMIIFLEGQSL